MAKALADGWARARPQDEIVLSPLADGGEGTLEAVAAAGGWEWRTNVVHDPLGRPVEARWLRSARRATAVIEMARPPGSRWLRAEDRDPIARHEQSAPAS